MAAEASRSSGSADSYLGSLISLTSKSEIRYEGVLFTINTEEASIGLRNVRSFGTEGRKKDGPQVPPIDKVYEYIVFRGSDIKDLQVKSSPPPQTASIQNDPAIIQSQYSQAPTSASLPHVSNAAVLDASAQNSQISQSGLPRSPFQSSLPLHQPEGSISSRSSSAIPPASGPMMPMYQHGLYGASTNVQSQQQPMLQPPQSIPGQSVSGPDIYQQGLYGASSNFQSQQPPMLQPPQSFPGQSVSGPDMYQQGLYSASSNVQSQQPPMLQPPQSFHGQSVSGPDMYQQGFYGASGNLQSQQPPMLQPTQCYPGQSVSGPADTSMSLLPSKTLSEVPLPVSQSPGLPHTSPVSNALDTKGVNTFTNQMKPVSSPMASYNGMPEPLATAVGSSTSPMLVTPGQFVQPGSAPLSASQHMQTSHKVVESVQLSSSVQMQSPAVSAPASASVSEALPKSAESQAPLLPLPPPVNQEFDRVPMYNRYIHEGRRGRGRGSELLNSATRFTEDFDFEAMNEKFNKNEVWGHLGKAKVDDNEDSQYNDNVVELPQFEAKPVYNKDDFFDSLTSNFHGNGSRNNGRPRFSEQRRFDTNETYGEFSSYRGDQGERGPGYGRFNRGGYYGRGYGNAGSGRGQYNVYRAT